MKFFHFYGLNSRFSLDLDRSILCPLLRVNSDTCIMPLWSFSSLILGPKYSVPGTGWVNPIFFIDTRTQVQCTRNRLSKSHFLHWYSDPSSVPGTGWVNPLFFIDTLTQVQEQMIKSCFLYFIISFILDDYNYIHCTV